MSLARLCDIVQEPDIVRLNVAVNTIEPAGAAPDSIAVEFIGSSFEVGRLIHTVSSEV